MSLRDRVRCRRPIHSPTEDQEQQQQQQKMEAQPSQERETLIRQPEPEPEPRPPTEEADSLMDDSDKALKMPQSPATAAPRQSATRLLLAASVVAVVLLGTAVALLPSDHPLLVPLAAAASDWSSPWRWLWSPAPDDAAANRWPDGCNFTRLAERHPRQSAQLWRRLQSAIRGEVLQQAAPQQAVFLLVHEAPPPAHSPLSPPVSALMADIAQLTEHCFRISPHFEATCTASAQPTTIRLQPADFGTEAVRRDHGHLVDRVRRELVAASGGGGSGGGGPVLLVLDTDLAAVPAAAAQALHFLCDTQQPPVDRSVVLMRLELPSPEEEEVVEEEGEQGKVAAAAFGRQMGGGGGGGGHLCRAERRLAEAWRRELGPNVFGPLMTRVTDQVLLVV